MIEFVNLSEVIGMKKPSNIINRRSIFVKIAFKVKTVTSSEDSILIVLDMHCSIWI